MRSFGRAVLALFALAAVGVLEAGCKPSAGDACEKGKAACQDDKTALVCQGGKYIASPCKGARGCAVTEGNLWCDATGNAAGDVCSTDSEDEGSCTADGKHLLTCKIRRVMPSRLHSEPSEAFASLARPAGAEIHAAVEAAMGQACGAGAAHHRLRELLVLDPQLTLSDAARALGMSERSLQRGLHEAGTSFRAERRRARIAEAKALLTETDDKLHAVAGRLGCASLPQFGRSFRRATGETPGAFRERQRR